MTKHIDYGALVRIWDNGGDTADRYTVAPPANAWRQYRYDDGLWFMLSADAAPFHPQGIGMHCDGHTGRHLGKRIHWSALPADVQRFARQSFPEFCPKVTP